MLQEHESQRIVDAILAGGSEVEAVTQWAANRGYEYNPNEGYRLLNPPHNFANRWEADVDWCPDTDNWDSTRVEVLAGVLARYAAGEPLREVAKQYNVNTVQAYGLIPDSLKRPEDADIFYKRYRVRAVDESGRAEERFFKTERAAEQFLISQNLSAWEVSGDLGADEWEPLSYLTPVEGWPFDTRPV